MNWALKIMSKSVIIYLFDINAHWKGFKLTKKLDLNVLKKPKLKKPFLRTSSKGLKTRSKKS